MISRTNRVFALSTLILCALIAFFSYELWGGVRLSPGREITLTSEGFEPRKLVIQEGESVTFKTDIGESFWPASDSHPTHSIYPDFDPRMPVVATSSWSFMFKRAGTWEFHDHLYPRYSGKIIVLTKDGSEVSESCAADTRSQKCYEEKIISVLKKRGIEEAFDTIAELYERYPDFRSSCHSSTHSLGAAAYGLFEKGRLDGLSPKTPYCGYGFYHGFMEEMLARKGSVDEAQNFCKEAGRILAKHTADAEGACYHGIGHGAVDGSDPTTWGDPIAMMAPGIKLCEKIAPVETFKGNRYRCVTGAYNSIEILSMDPKYKLDSIIKDPFSICKGQKDSYLEGCYTNLLPALMRKIQGSYPEAIAAIMALPEGTKADPVRSMVLASLMHDYIRTDAQNKDFPQRGVDMCRGVGEDLRIPCIEGISGGYMKYGEPQREYIKAFEFCSSDMLRDDEEAACYLYIFDRLRIWYSEDKISELCKTVPSSIRHRCDPRTRGYQL
jgi:hypothetical protein